MKICSSAVHCLTNRITVNRYQSQSLISTVKMVMAHSHSSQPKMSMIGINRNEEIVFGMHHSNLRRRRVHALLWANTNKEDFIHRSELSISSFRNLQSSSTTYGEGSSTSTSTGGTNDNVDGVDRPTAILIMACVLFCVVLAPVCVKHGCKRRREFQQRERLRIIHQRAMEDAGMIGVGSHDGMIGGDSGGILYSPSVMLGGLGDNGNEVPSTADISMSLRDLASRNYSSGSLQLSGLSSYNFSLRSMTLEDRKEYIENLLVSKRIIKINGVECATDSNSHDHDHEGSSQKPDDLDDRSSSSDSPKTIRVLLGDEMDVTKTSDEVIPEQCPICLVDYEEKDTLMWSQSDKCAHMFHKGCIVEWLLRNRHCPLCRHNYLSLADDDDDDEEGGGGNGLHFPDDLQMWNVVPVPQRVQRRRFGYDSSYRTGASLSSYRSNNMRLHHGDMSVAVPSRVSMPGLASRNRRHSSAEQMTSDAAYIGGIELIQLLNSLQMLSEAQQNASVQLEGIELMYPRRQQQQQSSPPFTLHQTRTRTGPSYPSQPTVDNNSSVLSNSNEENERIEDDEPSRTNTESSVEISGATSSDSIDGGEHESTEEETAYGHVETSHDESQSNGDDPKEHP